MSSQSGESRPSPEQKRIKAAKLTIAGIVVALMALALFRMVTDSTAGYRPSRMLLQIAEEGKPTAAEGKGDPLGISSNELVFEQCSEDGMVIWYSTAGDRAYSQWLVEEALHAQGWLASTDGSQAVCSYVRVLPNAYTPMYAMVLFYEQKEGCEIIIEVL